MTEYKTPGVYVKEISKFPPSVAGVATAIPAFIGFTEKPEFDKDRKPQVVKIKSLLDYESLFGEGPELKLNDNGELQNHKFVMYDSIRLFYDNGGGTCYVVSIGDYKSTDFDADQYKKGLEPLKKVDEVTLLVAPDAAMLLDEIQLGALHQAMLEQCAVLGDRFAILDPKLNNSLDDALETFRKRVGNNDLAYGAAYYPFLRTTYTKSIEFNEMLKIEKIEAGAKKIGLYNDYYAKTDKELAFGIVQEKLLEGYKKALLDKYNEEIQLLSEEIKELKKNETGNKEAIKAKEKAKNEKETARDNSDEKKRFDELGNFSMDNNGELLYSDAAIAVNTFITPDANPIGKEVHEAIAAEIEAILPDVKAETKTKKPLMAKAFAAQIEGYAEKLAEKLAEASIIPPSGAIAGIYAATDGSKGVWQAPANVSVAAVHRTDFRQRSGKHECGCRHGQIGERHPFLHGQGHPRLGRPHLGRQQQRMALRASAPPVQLC